MDRGILVFFSSLSSKKKQIPFTVLKPPVVLVLNRFDNDRQAHAAGRQCETNLTAAGSCVMWYLQQQKIYRWMVPHLQ
jgi:hypothetical protein